MMMAPPDPECTTQPKKTESRSTDEALLVAPEEGGQAEDKKQELIVPSWFGKRRN
jgi:hypothetical protein